MLLKFKGSAVAQCLTRHREAAGSSLNDVTAVWSLIKTHLSWLSTGSTKEDRPCLTERLLMGRKESNQTNNLKFNVYPRFAFSRQLSSLLELSS